MEHQKIAELQQIINVLRSNHVDTYIYNEDISAEYDAIRNACHTLTINPVNDVNADHFEPLGKLYLEMTNSISDFNIVRIQPQNPKKTVCIDLINGWRERFKDIIESIAIKTRDS